MNLGDGSAHQSWHLAHSPWQAHRSWHLPYSHITVQYTKSFKE